MGHVVSIALREPVSRDGLVHWIGEAPDLEVGVVLDDPHRVARDLGPDACDVLVVDLLPGEGADLALLATCAETAPTLVLAAMSSALLVEQSLQRGVRGFVLRSDSEAEVLAGIRAVAAGGTYIGPDHGGLTGDPGAAAGAPPTGTGDHGSNGGVASRVPGLTPREMEVFLLMGRGKSATEMAAALHRSRKTIYTHRANIRQKLRCRSDEEVVRAAALWLQRAARTES